MFPIPMILPPYGQRSGLIETLLGLDSLSKERRAVAEYNSLQARVIRSIESLEYIPDTEALVTEAREALVEAGRKSTIGEKIASLKPTVSKLETELKRVRKVLLASAKEREKEKKNARKFAKRKAALIEEAKGLQREVVAVERDGAATFRVHTAAKTLLDEGVSALDTADDALNMDSLGPAKAQLKTAAAKLKKVRKAIDGWEKQALRNDKKHAIRDLVTHIRDRMQEYPDLLGEAKLAKHERNLTRTLENLRKDASSFDLSLSNLTESKSEIDTFLSTASNKLIHCKEGLKEQRLRLTSLREIALASELIEAYSLFDLAEKALGIRNFSLCMKHIASITQHLDQRAVLLQNAADAYRDARSEIGGLKNGISGLLETGKEAPGYDPTPGSMSATLKRIESDAGKTLSFTDAVALLAQLSTDLDKAKALKLRFNDTALVQKRAELHQAVLSADAEAGEAIAELEEKLVTEGIEKPERIGGLVEERKQAMAQWEVTRTSITDPEQLSNAAVLGAFVQIMTKAGILGTGPGLVRLVEQESHAARLKRLEKLRSDVPENLERLASYPGAGLDGLQKRWDELSSAAAKAVAAEDFDALDEQLDAGDQLLIDLRGAWGHEEALQRDIRHSLKRVYERIGVNLEELERLANKSTLSFALRAARTEATQNLPRLNYWRDTFWAMTDTRLWTAFHKAERRLEDLDVEVDHWLAAVKGDKSPPQPSTDISASVAQLQQRLKAQTKRFRRFRPSRLDRIGAELDDLKTELASPTESYSRQVASYNAVRKSFRETVEMVDTDVKSLSAFKKERERVWAKVLEKKPYLEPYAVLWKHLEEQKKLATSYSKAEGQIPQAGGVLADLLTFLSDLDSADSKSEFLDTQEALHLVEQSEVEALQGRWEARSDALTNGLFKQVVNPDAKEQLKSLYKTASALAEKGSYEQALKRLDSIEERVVLLLELGPTPRATALDELPGLVARWRKAVGGLQDSINGFADFFKTLEAPMKTEIPKVLSGLVSEFQADVFTAPIELICAKSTAAPTRRSQREVALDAVRRHREALRQRRMVLLSQCPYEDAPALGGHEKVAVCLDELERQLLMAVPTH